MPALKKKERKTILCIDDDGGTLAALRRVLRPLKHEVITSKGGKKAIALAKKKNPDLIFLDIHMPKMNGYDVLKQLQQEGLRTIPVVMLTGDRTDEAIVKGYQAGSIYYITKPFKNEYIRNIAAFLIGNLSEAEQSEMELKL